MIYHTFDIDWDGDPFSLDDLQATVDAAILDLKHKRGYDSIVVTGMSGALVGAPVALALKKPLVILRKPDEKAHGAWRKWINESRLGKRSLWLDDFVAGGGTRRRVRKAVAERGGTVAAEYLYKDRTYRRVR